MRVSGWATLYLSVLISFTSTAQIASAETNKPNVILIPIINFGYGELGVYGGGVLRGAATDRIDALAAEGMRRLNFNIEAQYTHSSAALLTGCHAVRTGNATVPLDIECYGRTQWKYKMPEMLSDAGYVTGRLAVLNN